MFFLTLRPSDPISPWEKKRTGSQTLPASPKTLPPPSVPIPTTCLSPSIYILNPLPLHHTVIKA